MPYKALTILLGLLAFSLPLSISLSEAFYFLAFLAWLIRIVCDGRKVLRRTRLEIPIAVLAVAYILATLFSVCPLESVRILRKLIFFGLIFVLANSLSVEAEKKRLIVLWLLGAIAACVWTVVDYSRGTARPGGFFGPMTFAHFALLFLGVSLSLTGLQGDRQVRIVSISAFALGMAALFFTFTRGAWIGFIAGLAVFLIIKRRWAFLAASAALVLVACSVFSVYFPNSEPGQAVRSIVHPFDRRVPRVASSNLQHLYKWKASWMMFKQHPLLGIGPNQYDEALPNYLSEKVNEKIFHHRTYNHAHSIYFDHLATMGIIGFGGLFIFLFAAFRALIYRYKSHSSGFEKSLTLGVLIALVGFCVGGLTHQSFHDSEILLNLCFLLGLVL